ncbi:hypothetical protein [Microbacterium phyllosphaerae]|uniref:hypothetical protein n=1 Tax=Microbacterium phyllosphaerae TaxID=124798 RepID=UPI003D64BEC0
MTTAAEAPTRRDLRSRRSLSPEASPVTLAPLSAREAVGRRTGIERVAPPASRAPFWQAAGIVGLIAVIAAATLPLIAQILSLPL